MAPRTKKALVLGFYQMKNSKSSADIVPTEALKMELSSKAHGSILSKALSSFEGKASCIGKTRLLWAVSDEYDVIAMACLGPTTLGYNDVEEIDMAKESVRIAVAAGCREIWDNADVDEIYVDDCKDAKSAAEGAVLGLWAFDCLKSKQKKIPSIQLLRPNEERLASWNDGLVICRAQNEVRWLCEMPANKMTPTAVAQYAKEKLEPLGVSVQIHDKAWAEEQKMGSFLSVSLGSVQPPVFLEMEYKGAADGVKPIALVGKGITFDSGGISLKVPSEMMDDMREDMGGGATVIGTFLAIAGKKAPVNLIGLVPLTENMPSGSANKVMDVVTAKNGKTIQINNTDAEGRLILADALCYAEKFDPSVIIDLATLTGAMRIALGCAATGCFTEHRDIYEKMHKAAVETGDRVWRMPLWEAHTHSVTDARLADLANVSKWGRLAGSSTAAAFLKEFVPNGIPWMHMDIAGSSDAASLPGEPAYHPKNFSGRPLRTLVQFVLDYEQ